MSISPASSARPVRSLSAPASTQLGVYSPRVHRLLWPKEGTEVAKCIAAVEGLLNADKAQKNPKDRSFSPLATMLLTREVQRFREAELERAREVSCGSGTAVAHLQVKAEEAGLAPDTKFDAAVRWLRAQEPSKEAIQRVYECLVLQPQGSLTHLAYDSVTRAINRVCRKLQGGSSTSPASSSSSAAAAAASPVPVFYLDEDGTE